MANDSFNVGGGTFVPLSTTDDQAKAYIHDAQVALHSIYGRDKTTANHLYDDMRQYGLSGGHPIFGSPPDGQKYKDDAAKVLYVLWSKGGQDQADAMAISHFFNVPASQVIKFGSVAPASVDPGSVSQSFTKSAAATANAALSGVGVTSFLAALANPHTWLRVAEVVAGAILLIVGLNQLVKDSTGRDVMRSTIKTGGKLAKVAAL